MVPRELHIGIQRTARDESDAAWRLAPKLLASWGDEDAHTVYEMSRRLLDLHPSAQLSVYQGIGHAPFYEDATRFNKELASFINEAGG
jgi:pimeloyl-ACP methyl ester carboxylesterase